MSHYAAILIPLLPNRRNIQGEPTPLMWIPNPSGVTPPVSADEFNENTGLGEVNENTGLGEVNTQ